MGYYNYNFRNKDGSICKIGDTYELINDCSFSLNGMEFVGKKGEKIHIIYQTLKYESCIYIDNFTGVFKLNPSQEEYLLNLFQPSQ